MVLKNEVCDEIFSSWTKRFGDGKFGGLKAGDCSILLVKLI